METVIKKIPDSDAEGDLDPRALEAVLGSPRFQKSFTVTGSPLPIREERVRRARAFMEGSKNLDVSGGRVRSESRTIPGRGGSIPVSIHTPRTVAPMPAVVYIHGGGFIGNTFRVLLNPCKALADKAGAVVVSVDYRLAPEHPFPAGLDDCLDAVRWVRDNAAGIHADASCIGVAGDSAGANLATVCALLDARSGERILGLQAMVYPVVTLSGRPTEDYEWSIEEYDIRHHEDVIRRLVQGLSSSDGFLLDAYVQGKAAETDPRVSPLLADDLSIMPEALVVTAEYDFLRVQGEAYARKLDRAGVKTRLVRYRGMDHGFLDRIGTCPQAEDCMAEIARAIREKFRGGRSGSP